jgi:hypothetical protein
LFSSSPSSSTSWIYCGYFSASFLSLFPSLRSYFWNLLLVFFSASVDIVLLYIGFFSISFHHLLVAGFNVNIQSATSSPYQDKLLNAY